LSLPPLLLVHGWAHDGSAWTPLTESLGDSFSAIAPSFPGHGGQRALEEPLTLARMADEVAGWCRALEEPPVVVGWSLGALAAMAALVAEDAPPVAGLVVIGGFAAFLARDGYRQGQDPAVLERLRQWTLRDSERARSRFARWLELDEPAPVVAPPLQTAMVETLQVLARGDLRARLPAITAPTMVVHGERDRVVPLRAGELVAELIPGATMVTMDAGHAPMLECPAALARHVAEHARVCAGTEGGET
jgi:pimeloyl-[acyl-carrier protein] methyl ester esterase